ncbi:MAG TPA: hypothetical protein VGR11_11975 [Solirubrobacteraceae bacterium]|nr:hypothetical protein [Solirubrobacteraceae bacterium]
MFDVLDDLRPAEQIRQRMRVIFVELHAHRAFIRVALVEDDDFAAPVAVRDDADLRTGGRDKIVADADPGQACLVDPRHASIVPTLTAPALRSSRSAASAMFG